MNDKKRPQFHASILEMKCGEQIRRRYIEREIIPPGVFIIAGQGTHKGIQANMQHIIDTERMLRIGDVLDAARDGVNKAWKTGVRLEPEEKSIGVKKLRGLTVDKAIRLSKLHYQKLAPKIKPIYAERSWSLKLSGYPFDLVGRIDIQEKRTIRDAKSTQRTPNKKIASVSVQMKVYAMAAYYIDHIMPRTVLDYLIDAKIPKAKSYPYYPNKEDIQVVLSRLDIFHKAFKSGIFLPVEPGHWVCSERFCGYFSTCRYVKHPKSIIVP